MLTAETVDRIVRFDGHGLPVSCLYAHVDADPGLREDLHARVTSLLDEINPLAKDEATDHEARLSVRGDIDRIKESLAQERWKPGAIAIFACSGRDLYEEVPLPRRVRDEVVTDTLPHVRPMLTVLDEYHRTCVAVVDKASAQIWEIYQDELREIGNVRDRALRKPNYAAGRVEERVRNKADELSKRHYRNVVQFLEQQFRAEDFDLLVIGGHDYEVPAFVDFLPNDMRSLVAGTFSVDPAEPVLAEVRANADAILHSYEHTEEEQYVSDIFDKMASGGPAVAGLDRCLWAGSIAAIQTLLVLDGAVVPGVVCDESGWLARSGDICPLCSKPTRPTPDILDELAQEVIAESGSVKHIADDDRLAEPLAAASIRFPLPPRPPSSPAPGHRLP
jgi:Bacterial archaeo-eukaryotic release factor family 10